MSKYTVKFYYTGGQSIVKDVEAESMDELAEVYKKAINNKKNRTFTWESNVMQTVINLDNIVLISIEEQTDDKE